MRSKKTIRPHLLNQSRLYRLLGKELFEKILGITWERSGEILSLENYNVFPLEKDKKSRIIQEPIKALAPVHVRIKRLLAHIEMPDYVYSQAGRSCIDKALQHLGNTSLIKIDIKQFYQNTKRYMVYQMFAGDFECAKDIALRLANLCCYQNKFLPTGSPLSGFIAFFAAKNMFDELANFAISKQCKMAVFVDDIVFSGENAVKRIVDDIHCIIRNHGYEVNKRKTRVFAPHSAKKIVGVIIHGNQTLAPHKSHKKNWKIRQALTNASLSGKDRSKLEARLRGGCQNVSRILEASSIARTERGSKP